MLNSYVPLSGFITNQPLSAIDLETMRKNAWALYETVQKFETPIFQHNLDRRTQGVTPNEGSLVSGYGWEVFWHGAFQFYPGMTHFRIEGYREIPTQSGGSDNFKAYIWVNGTPTLLSTASLAANSTGSFYFEWPISGYGFAENEIVQVQLDYDKPNLPGANVPSIYHITGVFAYPIVNQDTWPGLPALTGNNAFSQANLNQLIAAEDWLLRRINKCPVLPITSSFAAKLSWGRGAGPPAYWHDPDQSMWSGAAVAANDRTLFRIKGQTTFKDGQERYILYKDNVAVDWWPSSSTYSTPYTTAQWDLEATMSANSTAHFRIGNLMVPNTGFEDNPNTGTGRSRHAFYSFEVEKVGAYGTVGGSNDKTTVHESKVNLTYATVRGRLNGIKDVLQATYDHITNNIMLFSRYYVIRPMALYRDKDNADRALWSYGVMQRRKGTKLWVRGRGVSVQYGPVKLATDGDVNSYEFMFNEEVIPGDQMQNTYLYLDSLPGLFYGMAYAIRGTEVIFSAEQLY